MKAETAINRNIIPAQDGWNEETTKLRAIMPAVLTVGWREEQIECEYPFTDGRIQIRGTRTSRGGRKRADYALFTRDRTQILALIEAKAAGLHPATGLQQVIEYGTTLDVPFVYATNGKEWIEHDFLTGKERTFALAEFPPEAELWRRYCKAKQLTATQEAVVREPYYTDSQNKREPRYYQRIAINRTVEAVAKGQRRVLLVMATGTGKTYTAFQIIHRLYESKQVRRVLFLADRNNLIDQTIRQDFQPFGNKMTKVTRRKLNSAYEIYLSLYQQLVDPERPADEQPYTAFSPDFFDLVVIDECHRGSAMEDSAWRQVLDYFSGAIHIGMTATPLNTETVSSRDYFGAPIYTYSLKEGIADGFLAPYKVVRSFLDLDTTGWRPHEGQRDDNGILVEDRLYTIKDMDRRIIFPQRLRIVARRVLTYLRGLERIHGAGHIAKAIIFCVNEAHALNMRNALVEECAAVDPLLAARLREHPDYIVRITASEPDKALYTDKFIDPYEDYPAIATTSKLLSTGVDAKTVELIVLDSPIESMTEFKQIIGRGTRLFPRKGKEYFTIMDFRGVTKLFADPNFDGEPDGTIDWPPKGADPVAPLPPVPDDPSVPGGDEPIVPQPPQPPQPSPVLHTVSEARAKLIYEMEQYIDPKTGKLIRGNLLDYTRTNILGEYATLHDFLHEWNEAERRSAIVDALRENGAFLDEIRAKAGDKYADCDDFDLILDIAFGEPAVKKQERIRRAKAAGVLDGYSDTCRRVLETLLEKYRDGGIGDLEDLQILATPAFADYGNPRSIAAEFGGREEYLQAVRKLSDAIYQVN